MPCDDVLLAIGQENAFLDRREIGLAFDRGGMPKVDPLTMQSTPPTVFFGGIPPSAPRTPRPWRTGTTPRFHDKLCRGEDLRERPPPDVTLISQKMGIHEWSYDNDIASDQRHRRAARQGGRLKDAKMEVELASPRARLSGNAALPQLVTCRRCSLPHRIECDACVDICP
jgi:hypothetical protein